MAKEKPLLIRRPTRAQLFEIRSDLEQTLENGGPYLHNIISCTLRIVADKHGLTVADELVEEFNLDELLGIPQEIPQKVAKAIQ